MDLKKKAGIVGAGVLTAVVVASPFAWATGDGHDGHDDGKKCQFTGGNSSAASSIPGGSLGNIVTQAPVGGNNAGNLANCSDFLNGNLNGNLSGNDISLLSDEPADAPAPVVPLVPVPDAPAADPAPVDPPADPAPAEEPEQFDVS